MSFINIFFVLQIMASTILPFLILIWLTNGNSMIVRENVIFEQSHEISTTRSRWLVTMVIDLSVYDQSIDKLYSALDEVNRINNVLVKFYDVPLKDKYFQTFKGLELEIINLRTAQDAVYNNFQILSPLHDLTVIVVDDHSYPLLVKLLVFYLEQCRKMIYRGYVTI